MSTAGRSPRLCGVRLNGVAALESLNPAPKSISSCGEARGDHFTARCDCFHWQPERAHAGITGCTSLRGRTCSTPRQRVSKQAKSSGRLY